MGPARAARYQTPLVVSIDAGSSSIRAIVFDGRGRALPNYHAELPHRLQTTPEGGAVLDADQVVANVVKCLGALRARRGFGAWGKQVAAVSCSMFMHSLVGTDRAGRALTPLYTWADTRSRVSLVHSGLLLDKARIHQRTGCPFHPSYPLAKLLWLRQTQRRLFGRVHRWLTMGDYLYLQLFGRPTLSYSMASGTGLFSHRALDWEPTLLERVGVKREQLGELVDFDARNTGLAGKHAAGLKEFAGMPWFPAMADSACSNMGSGCVDASRLALNLGTSGAMRVVFNGPLKKIPDGLFCYVVGRGRLLLGGSISNCGNLRRWLLETFQLETNLDQNLAAMKPDSHGLTMLPFLAGERAPFWPRDVTGILVGLRGATRPIDIARAAFEALTYQLALIHERLVRTFPQAQKVIVSGGASSRWWVQMMADTFLMPVQFLQTAEASSRGAALLALEALGVVRDAASIEAPWGELVQPNEARSKIYRKSLRHYEALCHRWTTE